MRLRCRQGQFMGDLVCQRKQLKSIRKLLKGKMGNDMVRSILDIQLLAVWEIDLRGQDWRQRNQLETLAIK